MTKQQELLQNLRGAKSFAILTLEGVEFAKGVDQLKKLTTEMEFFAVCKVDEVMDYYRLLYYDKNYQCVDWYHLLVMQHEINAMFIEIRAGIDLSDVFYQVKALVEKFRSFYLYYPELIDINRQRVIDILNEAVIAAERNSGDVAPLLDESTDALVKLHKVSWVGGDQFNYKYDELHAWIPDTVPIMVDPIEDLREQLSEAVEVEDYDRATTLRDQIIEMERNGTN